MNAKRESLGLPEGLIQLPEGILRRALGAISPRSGVEPLTELVVEALTQYLDEAEPLPQRQVRPSRSAPKTPNLAFSQLNLSTATDFPGRLYTEAARPIESPEPRRIPAYVPADLDQEPEGRAAEVFVEAAAEIGQFVAELSEIPEGEATGRLTGRVLSWSEIEPITCCVVSDQGEVQPPEQKKPLFGFHNRDFPSLWGLEFLARATPDEPVLWSDFALGLDLLSQQFGILLRQLDAVRPADHPRGQLRFATSFPKPGRGGGSTGGQWLLSPEGERRAHLSPFVKNNFARIQKTAGTVQAAGPLPQWGAIAFFPEGKDYRVGLTQHGLDLLNAVAGCSIELPHSPGAARGFIGYLKKHAPEDWQGFDRVVGAIESGPDRDDLVRENATFFSSFRETRIAPEKDNFPSTMTQGYVSRGREWGLIAPDLAPSKEGKRVRYQLTELGERFVSDDGWS